MNIAIILSGGVGSRMGLNLPKQYVLVNRQPVINYCLRYAQNLLDIAILPFQRNYDETSP